MTLTPITPQKENFTPIFSEEASNLLQTATSIKETVEALTQKVASELLHTKPKDRHERLGKYTPPLQEMTTSITTLSSQVEAFFKNETVVWNDDLVVTMEKIQGFLSTTRDCIFCYNSQIQKKKETGFLTINFSSSKTAPLCPRALIELAKGYMFDPLMQDRFHKVATFISETFPSSVLSIFSDCTEETFQKEWLELFPQVYLFSDKECSRLLLLLKKIITFERNDDNDSIVARTLRLFASHHPSLLDNFLIANGHSLQLYGVSQEYIKQKSQKSILKNFLPLLIQDIKKRKEANQDIHFELKALNHLFSHSSKKVLSLLLKEQENRILVDLLVYASPYLSPIDASCFNEVVDIFLSHMYDYPEASRYVHPDKEQSSADIFCDVLEHLSKINSQEFFNIVLSKKDITLFYSSSLRMERAPTLEEWNKLQDIVGSLFRDEDPSTIFRPFVERFEENDLFCKIFTNDSISSKEKRLAIFFLVVLQNQFSLPPLDLSRFPLEVLSIIWEIERYEQNKIVHVTNSSENTLSRNTLSQNASSRYAQNIHLAFEIALKRKSLTYLTPESYQTLFSDFFHYLHEQNDNLTPSSWEIQTLKLLFSHDMNHVIQKSSEEHMEEALAKALSQLEDVSSVSSLDQESFQKIVEICTVYYSKTHDVKTLSFLTKASEKDSKIVGKSLLLHEEFQAFLSIREAQKIAPDEEECTSVKNIIIKNFQNKNPQCSQNASLFYKLYKTFNLSPSLFKDFPTTVRSYFVGHAIYYKDNSLLTHLVQYGASPTSYIIDKIKEPLTLIEYAMVSWQEGLLSILEMYEKEIDRLLQETPLKEKFLSQPLQELDFFLFAYTKEDSIKEKGKSLYEKVIQKLSEKKHLSHQTVVKNFSLAHDEIALLEKKCKTFELTGENDALKEALLSLTKAHNTCLRLKKNLPYVGTKLLLEKIGTIQRDIRLLIHNAILLIKISNPMVALEYALIHCFQNEVSLIIKENPHLLSSPLLSHESHILFDYIQNFSNSENESFFQFFFLLAKEKTIPDGIFTQPNLPLWKSFFHYLTKEQAGSLSLDTLSYLLEHGATFPFDGLPARLITPPTLFHTSPPNGSVFLPIEPQGKLMPFPSFFQGKEGIIRIVCVQSLLSFFSHNVQELLKGNHPHQLFFKKTLLGISSLATPSEIATWIQTSMNKSLKDHEAMKEKVEQATSIQEAIHPCQAILQHLEGLKSLHTIINNLKNPKEVPTDTIHLSTHLTVLKEIEESIQSKKDSWEKLKQKLFQKIPKEDELHALLFCEEWDKATSFIIDNPSQTAPSFLLEKLSSFLENTIDKLCHEDNELFQAYMRKALQFLSKNNIPLKEISQRNLITFLIDCAKEKNEQSFSHALSFFHIEASSNETLSKIVKVILTNNWTSSFLYILDQDPDSIRRSLPFSISPAHLLSVTKELENLFAAAVYPSEECPDAEERFLNLPPEKQKKLFLQTGNKRLLTLPYFSKEELFNYVQTLLQKEPAQKGKEAILQQYLKAFSLREEHYKTGLATEEVPTPDPVDLDCFTTILRKTYEQEEGKRLLDAFIESSCGDIKEKNIHTIFDLECFLNDFIFKLKNKKVLGGSPQFYSKIENWLQHVLLAIENEKDLTKVVDVFKECTRGSGYCSGQYETIASHLYRKLCLKKSEEMSPQEAFSNNLSQFRSTTLDIAAILQNPHAGAMMEVHQRTHALRDIGKRRGIIGFKEVRAIKDTYLPKGYDQTVILKHFDKIYNPSSIVFWLKDAIMNDEPMRNHYYNLIDSYLYPPSWNMKGEEDKELFDAIENELKLLKNGKEDIKELLALTKQVLLERLDGMRKEDLLSKVPEVLLKEKQKIFRSKVCLTNSELDPMKIQYSLIPLLEKMGVITYGASGYNS